MGLILIAGLTACAGFGSSANPQAAAPGLEQLSPDAPPAADGIAGHYAGKIYTGKKAVGRVTMDLSQSGAAAGGSASLLIGTLALSAATSMNISAAAVATGTLVVIPTKTFAACSFSISKGSFNPATLMLKGKLTAFNGCTGQKYTFAAKEACYYKVATPVAAAAMPRVVPKPC